MTKQDLGLESSLIDIDCFSFLYCYFMSHNLTIPSRSHYDHWLQGEERISEVTGKPEPYYPAWKRNVFRSVFVKKKCYVLAAPWWLRVVTFYPHTLGMAGTSWRHPLFWSLFLWSSSRAFFCSSFRFYVRPCNWMRGCPRMTSLGWYWIDLVSLANYRSWKLCEMGFYQYLWIKIIKWQSIPQSKSKMTSLSDNPPHLSPSEVNVWCFSNGWTLW